MSEAFAGPVSCLVALFGVLLAWFRKRRTCSTWLQRVRIVHAVKTYAIAHADAQNVPLLT